MKRLGVRPVATGILFEAAFAATLIVWTSAVALIIFTLIS